MKIYSETTISFALKCEQMLKEILVKEVGVKLRRTRFEWGKYSYPLQVVVIETKLKLGYFDPHSYQIAVNSQLMYTVKDNVLRDVLRHELAHYLTYIQYPDLSCPHGSEFKSLCEHYGWDRSVSKASLNIDLANMTEGNLDSERIINKVKALLKLAESDNVHEAELATFKANQLLLKHNIKQLDKDFETLYVCTALTAKRRNAKMQAIYDILQYFMVKPVFIYGKGQVTLEVSGTKENIDLAVYVSTFLDRELENLWKKNPQLKGARAKNSFFLGLAKGHQEKMEKLQQSFSAEETKALVLVKTKLDQNLKNIYRRLSYSSSKSGRDAQAFGAGKLAGKNLTINSALKSTKKNRFITWSRT